MYFSSKIIDKIKKNIAPYKIEDFEYEKLIILRELAKAKIDKKRFFVMTDFLYKNKYNYFWMDKVKEGVIKGIDEKILKILIKSSTSNNLNYIEKIIELSLSYHIKSEELVSILKEYIEKDLDYIFISLTEALSCGLDIKYLKENINYNNKGIKKIIKEGIEKSKFRENFLNALKKENINLNKDIDFYKTAFLLYQNNVPLYVAEKINKQEDLNIYIKIYKEKPELLQILKKYESIDSYSLFQLYEKYKKIGTENIKFILNFTDNLSKVIKTDVINLFILIFTEDKLNKDEILKYIDKDINPYKLDKLRFKIIKEKYKSQIEQIIKNEINLFDDKKIREIALGIKNGLSAEKIKIYAKKYFNSKQMKVIREAFEEGLNINKVKIFAKKRYNNNEMSAFKELIQTCPNKIVNFVKKEKYFDDLQMDNIKTAYKNGLSLEEIKIFADPQLETYDMEELMILMVYFKNILKIYLNMNSLEAEKYNLNYFTYFWNNNVSNEEIQDILEEIENKIRGERLKEEIPEWLIKMTLHPKMNYAIEKLMIRTYKEHNLNENQMKLMILTNFKIPAEIIKNIDIKNDKGRISLILKKDVNADVLNKLKEKLNVKEIMKKTTDFIISHIRT